MEPASVDLGRPVRQHVRRPCDAGRTCWFGDGPSGGCAGSRCLTLRGPAPCAGAALPVPRVAFRPARSRQGAVARAPGRNLFPPGTVATPGSHAPANRTGAHPSGPRGPVRLKRPTLLTWTFPRARAGASGIRPGTSRLVLGQAIVCGDLPVPCQPNRPPGASGHTVRHQTNGRASRRGALAGLRPSDPRSHALPDHPE